MYINNYIHTHIIEKYSNYISCARKPLPQLPLRFLAQHPRLNALRDRQGPVTWRVEASIAGVKNKNGPW